MLLTGLHSQAVATSSLFFHGYDDSSCGESANATLKALLLQQQ
jgi:hypothetical protein